MKLPGLLLSSVSVMLLALPAEAGRLLFWKFEPNQNRLVFATDGGVQPKAFLIFNPTRLVVDLPGTTLGQPTIKENYRGAVTSLRVGQMDSYTARLVLELAPGYTIDPRQVQFRGFTASQWSVQLPYPQRGAQPAPEPTANTNNGDFQVTENGFFFHIKDGSQPRDPKVTYSADGRQFNVDMEGVAIPNNLLSQVLPVDRYGVRAARFSQVQGLKNIARITLDLTPDSPNWQASVTVNPPGLALVPQSGSRVLAVDRTPIAQRDEEMITIPVPPPERNNTTPIPIPGFPYPPATPAPTTRPPIRPRATNGRLLIVVDPGHGGQDSGAIGQGGLMEKDVILDISLKLAQILEQQGMSVLMTRSDDTFISLEGRTDMANAAGANLFVSVHANSIDNRPDVNGLETYYYSSGERLANTVHRVVLQNANVRDRGVRQARFYVLRHSSMPSILVEVGFVTGNVDSRNLSNPSHRSQMARAIANGVMQYVRQNSLTR